MGLKEQLVSDIQRCMKGNDKLRLETLRSLRAALMEKEIEKRGSGSPVSADDELAVLNAAAKKRRESIEMFAQGGRTGPCPAGDGRTGHRSGIPPRADVRRRDRRSDPLRRRRGRGLGHVRFRQGDARGHESGQGPRRREGGAGAGPQSAGSKLTTRL